MKSLIEKKYQFIKQIVCDEGYEKEIDWQSQIEFKNIDESYFLKELSWVILSSGMKEQIIRRIFYEITPYFYNWKSAKKIVKNKQADDFFWEKQPEKKYFDDQNIDKLLSKTLKKSR